MRVTVIDGQGGRLGRQLVEAILARCPEHEITAIGTNTIATAAMIRGGAHHAATGENAVVVACRTADAIVGPIGIAIADALYGEITPTMAVAVGQSRATRILIPMAKCDTVVVGVGELGIQALVDEAVEKLAEIRK
jgi:hypothetical protein